MRRKRPKRVEVKDSKLTIALRKGVSIKGLVGFVNIGDGDDGSVYAKVSCLGFDPGGEDCGCKSDLKIRGKVIGTGSVIRFTACEWLDTLKEVELDSDLNRRKALAQNQYRAIIGHHYVARKRIALMAYVLDALKEDDRKALSEDLKEQKLDLKTLDDSQVKEYARKVSLIANEVGPDEADRYYD